MSDTNLNVSVSNETHYDTDYSTWAADVEFDFDFDGQVDSYSYESYGTFNNKHETSSTGSSSTYIDGATGETTDTFERTNFGKDGNVESHAEGSVKRDKDGNVIESISTLTLADGSKTVKKTDKDGNTTEERFDADGKLVATIEYGSSSDFWDIDIIYGKPEPEGMEFEQLSQKAGAVLIAEHIENDMAPEMLVDAFEFFM